ncbi:polyamine ABC transporter ATP-binding protein [Spongiactinospora gelatinilytica]|uniref:Spermidine/putrescine import ATP-binding protein PotA n=1 Tax=Spongiactinospora gelatinilytica TaxID=2666298 RepID=A0A2W2G9S6_9ACTN|nr:ABC transporter ATP-binding protein [Spongiactinospora gelatinilytica]PZG45111.1 polyamine ABC transporter ATP-binding protein [Spongiactinospora gelatinilytica]
MSPSPSDGSHGIRISRVSKVYPGTARPAVDDVSLDIAPGEFMTLLGPSGSGKTTMLSMLAGFVGVSAGSIEIDGRDVSRLKPHRRNLGVVFQQYALFPHMSVAKNVAFPLQQRRMPKADIETKVAEALKLVHLEPYADRLPTQLSGGQQQRVALARAVVYQPRALLMDEPLGALDRRLRDQLQREIARMHRELGMTFIFVTHDQHEALTLSDRIAVFNEGRIEQVGTPADLYERPETLFVAQFLGESTCFRGTVDRQAGVLRCERFSVRVPEAPETGSGVVIVRPERLELCADETEVPESHNRVAATVTDVVYVGTHHQVGLRFADGTTGMAMRLVGPPLPAAPGDDVTVAWDPAHQAVVADPAGAAVSVPEVRSATPVLP